MLSEKAEIRLKTTSMVAAYPGPILLVEFENAYCVPLLKLKLLASPESYVGLLNRANEFDEGDRSNHVPPKPGYDEGFDESRCKTEPVTGDTLGDDDALHSKNLNTDHVSFYR